MKLSKTKSSVVAQLSSRKMREKHALFAVEGFKSVADTLGLFPLEYIIVLDSVAPRVVAELGSIALQSVVYEVEETEMKRLSAFSTPSEIMAIYRLPERKDTFTTPNRGELYLMLDGVRDPGNLGTIIRTAHWFGVKRIYASRDTVDLYNPKTIQSTMGSLGRVEVEYGDLVSLIEGNPVMPVYGTLLNGENIYKAPLGNEGFVLMGNEGVGISEELRGLITSPLLIPPFDASSHSESLNVAIATAVTLSQFRSR